MKEQWRGILLTAERSYGWGEVVTGLFFFLQEQKQMHIETQQ